MSERIKRKEGITTSRIGNELGMLDIASGKYYLFNEVGTDIWEMLKEPMSYEMLLQGLRDLYDPVPETYGEKTRVFIDALDQRGLIEKM